MDLSSNPVVKAILANQNNVGNLFDMEEALCLWQAFKIDQKTRIIVKKNRFQAQQLYQRLSMLDERVQLFAVEESLRVQAIASSPEDKEACISALTQSLLDDSPRLIICNPAAFYRKLPDVDLFKASILTLSVDMDMDMKTLKEHLYRTGYARVNYVDRPCEYASRGGIVDIFSLEYENPIRIEFFDTQIESIRFFNEKTQRTIQTVDKITIGPATDLLFSDEQLHSIYSQIDAGLKKAESDLEEDAYLRLRDALEMDKQALSSYSTDAHLYWYFAYVNGASLKDYVAGQVILSTEEGVKQSFKHCLEDNISFMQEMVQERKALAKFSLFHDPNIINGNAQCFHDFLDFKDPVQSGLMPVEKMPLSKLSTLIQPDIYLAISSEHEKEVQAFVSDQNLRDKVHWISPIYYQGICSNSFILLTDKELFEKKQSLKKYQKSFKEGIVLENFLELEVGDYVVHENYGIGQYLGIQTRHKQGKSQDYLHIVYKGNDELFVPLSQFQLVRKFVSKEGVGVSLSQLGSDKWKKTKAKVSAKVEEIAARLVELYADRNQEIGYAFAKDDALQKEFEDDFPYEATIDQLRATEEIKREMEKSKPMDHLLCGDVGFGKTEVAIRVAFKAISNNKQVAFLCPTTILSMQHYKTLLERFSHVGANIALVNRFVSNKDIKSVQTGLKNGTIDIVVGTHRLLNDAFEYKDLGLLIIDEEQRFGVEHKEKMKEMKHSVDVLSLSATPIPRTLQMSLIGVRTISQLNTPPAQRHPIQTYVMEKRDSIVEEIISRELSRDGQVFYLYNRVSEIYRVVQKIQKQFPNHRVAVGHGKMNRDELEDTMIKFANGEFDILVCTTIIETGLDIANANTIIIDNADRFGLSQLYQIRGRVGRRDKIGYCYLMIQPDKELTEQSRKRLQSIKEFTQLGSGYKIAMRDLTIRGAGDMLGPQQAGFIDQVGMDLYLEMLSNAIKRHQGKAEEKPEKQKFSLMKLDGYIPQNFSSSDGDKLSLYQELDRIKNVNELKAMEEKVHDLYGHIPKQVRQLFDQKRLDWFVNQPHVKQCSDTTQVITITMDEEWSSNVNGIKLFEAMNKVSTNIKMKLTSGCIVVSLAKRGKYMDLLWECMHILLNQ